MRMRNVVPAIQIVVHIHFPVAVQCVNAAVEVFQSLAKMQRRHQFRSLPKKFQQRCREPIQVDENKILPRVHLYRHEPIFRPIEIAHALEFHHPFQRPIVPISPPVIRAPKLLRAALRLRHHRRRMMPANVVERA